MIHRYLFQGPTDFVLSQTLGVSWGTGNPVAPPSCKLVDLDNEAFLTDLDGEMSVRGFVRDDGSMAVPPSLIGMAYARLGADAAAVTGGAVTPSAWTTRLSEGIDAVGGSLLRIDASCQAGVLVGGSMRVIIDGGEFDDEVLAEQQYPVLASASPGSFTACVALPAGAGTYTVSLQVQANALGTITARAGSALILQEFIIP